MNLASSIIFIKFELIMKSIIEYLVEVHPNFSDELKQQIILRGKLIHIGAGDQLMSIGGDFRIIPLIVEGSVKVVREDENGHELFLYFLTPGQTCAMSVNCTLSNRLSEVNATAEEDTVLIGIPSNEAGDWLSKYPDWRMFILNTYQSRFTEMLHTIDGIAFKQLDIRVLEYLEDKSKLTNSNEIHSSHQDIATDLNTSREVVSRILKILEKQGKLSLGRNRIKLM